MATFPLKVMTIDHCFFEGDVDRIVVRTSQGDVGILPNHVPYIAALGIGALIIIQNGEKRIAAIADYRGVGSWKKKNAGICIASFSL